MMLAPPARTACPARITRPARTGRLVAQLAAVCLVLSLATAARAFDLDRWFVVELEGSRAGWMHERVHESGGQIHSTITFHLGMRRGETRIEITLSGGFIETPEGKPIRMWSRQEMGTDPVETVVQWLDDGSVEIETTQNGRTTSTTRPGPEGQWLAPEAARRFVAQRLASRAERIVVRTIDPLGGLTPVTITRDRFRPASVDVVGRRVPAQECVAVSSAAPGIESVEFLDRDGHVVRTEMQLGSMTLVVLAADEALARAKLDPPELMRSTFVTPSKRIDRPRMARSASYLLRVPDGEMPLPPSTGSQRTQRVDAQTVRVVVETGSSSAGDRRPEYTKGSSMVSIDDPEIVALAARGAGDGKQLALALRDLVHRHVRQKGLAVGFATASEVVRTREGDCSEHATLLAALLRARGIPARVASGLIYADSFAGSEDIFGYHMWAQALVEVDGEAVWIDLDPTLPREILFDATHIALATSALSDEEPSNALLTLVPLLGRLEIEVERVGY